MSCATAGNCAAGGYYTDGSNNEQAFVADEKNGVWHSAIEVPGTAATARVESISCPTAGDCVAAGTSGNVAFVVDEKNGTWGMAIQVAGVVNLGGPSTVTSVSCASAGNCSAGGSYGWQAFVVDETNGSWGNAIQVPGTAALNTTPDHQAGHGATVTTVSCPTAGNCTAGGHYEDSSFHTQAFVVDETSGVWGTAIELPGTAALNTGGGFTVGVDSISCASAGNCVAGGDYNDSTPVPQQSYHQQAFLAEETNGTWGTAFEVPGTAAVNSGGYADASSVSCTSPGNCSAGGVYSDGVQAGGNIGRQAFVIDETNGSWGTAIEVPGTAALNTADVAYVDSLSCSSAGGCAAGGLYETGSGSEGFVASSDADAAPPSTALAPAAASGLSGQVTTLSATLTSRGAPVPGETVSFALNGTSVGSATTDANGVATLQHVSLAGIHAGSYPAGVDASFAGDGSSEPPSNGSSALTVLPVGIVGLAGVWVSTTRGKIDSFDSSVGPYGGANHAGGALVLSNGVVSLAGVDLRGSATSTRNVVTVSSTTKIHGNVLAGLVAWVKGVVSGTVTQNSPSSPVAASPVSACSPYSAKTGITGGSFTYSRKTGDLTVKSGTVKLANGTYCLHTISLSQGASLSVSGPVTIDLTGRIAGNGHLVNQTNLPDDLRIDTSFSGSIVIAGSSHAYMTILAPKATVTIPSGSFFGRLLARTVNLGGSASFHADTH